MAHHYAYLRLLLRNQLYLDLDEYNLIETAQQGVVCSFMGMRLSSAFQPIVRAEGSVVGHEALLRPSLPDSGVFAPESAFEDALDADRLVLFDRLVRTIHLLNYSKTFDDEGLLFLNVHPQLLRRVSNHGRTFEQILHYYSVDTARVVIEISASELKHIDTLETAIHNYRSLGYRVAIDNFGAYEPGSDSYQSSLEKILRLRPEIVKLDRALTHTADLVPVISGIVEELHRAGIQVAVTGIETATQSQIARSLKADFLQGYHIGRPQVAAKPPLKSQTERFAA